MHFFGGQPRLSDEQIAQIEAFEQAMTVFHIEQRESVIRFAMVFCSCRKPCGCGKPHNDPPQVGCVVHGSFMLLPDGRVL